MKFYKKCHMCFAMAEHELKGMHLCEYHFIQISNNIFSSDGNERISELMRLLD